MADLGGVTPGEPEAGVAGLGGGALGESEAGPGDALMTEGRCFLNRPLRAFPSGTVILHSFSLPLSLVMNTPDQALLVLELQTAIIPMFLPAEALRKNKNAKGHGLRFALSLWSRFSPEKIALMTAGSLVVCVAGFLFFCCAGSMIWSSCAEISVVPLTATLSSGPSFLADVVEGGNFLG